MFKFILCFFSDYSLICSVTATSHYYLSFGVSDAGCREAVRVVGFDVLTDGAVQAPSDTQDNQQEQDNLARKIVVSHRFVSGPLAIAAQILHACSDYKSLCLVHICLPLQWISDTSACPELADRREWRGRVSGGLLRGWQHGDPDSQADRKVAMPQLPPAAATGMVGLQQRGGVVSCGV